MSGLGALFSGGGAVPSRSIGTSGIRRAMVELPSSARSAEPSALRRGALRAAAVLVAVGLFTMSWDRLLNLQVASYYVKVPAVVFTAAFALAVLAGRDRLRGVIGSGPRRVVLVLTTVIVGYELVRGLLSAVPTAALAQIVALLTGAVLPALAILLVVRTGADLRWALRWLLAGALVAAVFGGYQLLAFYLGWPQGIQYSGVGIGTGIGRISAFNYEPAYFAYYVVLALGACIALRRLEGRDVRWRELVGFAAVLYLANVRAVPLVVLGFGILLLLAFRPNRRLLARGAVVGAATVVVALAVPLVIASVTAAQQDAAAHKAVSQQPARAQDRHAPAPESESGASRREGAPAAKAIESQLQTVNPDEPTSNGPRLDLYKAVLGQVAQSPVFGIGPGNLAVALRRDNPATVADQGAGQVVANNIWLQALADGGVPLLLLELALIGTVAVAALRRRGSAVFPLAATWLGVLLVGGMLTSYFFDIKVWSVLALLLVGFTAADDPGGRRAAQGAA